MNKKIYLILILTVFSLISYSQKKTLYDIEANPSERFKNALSEAKKADKHVMVQIGGNWCPWCFRFHDFYENDVKLDSLLDANYVIINVNYDPRKNQDFFAQLDYPQRFGFPVIVITDAEGNRLHTQNSWYLEDGKNSYDREKFKSFLKNWTVKAVDPESYKK